ncbi:MAG: SUMF1/EgtB/PvdO family nonheme iron enzyme [bacterium]|nr:SUMF1/EgtB/PvdO family nonheme iron enzyme [bacterium]
MPEGRSRVYRAVLDWLIASPTKRREAEGFSERFGWRAFAALGLAMMNAEGGKRSILDLEAAAVAIAPVVQRDFPDLEDEDRRRRARRWLRFECLGSGILEEISGNRLRFWHLTFQEYLAALQLAWRSDEDDPATGWWPLALEHLADAQWRETIELLPGCLLDEGGEGRVDKLLDRVLSLRGEEEELSQEAWVASVVGRLLQPLAAYGYTTRPGIRLLYEEALNRSLEIFEPEGASRVAVKVRIAAAEALGQGGDPRLSRSSFLEVPGIEGNGLGQYPVTVEEYQRFVDHLGYEEDRFWSVEGWQHRQEEDWEAPGEWAEQLLTPNRPVVNVSWYEAAAYCRWLSHQRGEAIRLPREVEWEKAATPEKGGYPWGEEEPDAERANFDGDVGSPTPVGVYPLGNGPYGHSDLAGNVWEWCEEEETLGHWEGAPWEKGAKGRLLRGGAWLYPAQRLRAALRRRRRPALRDDNVGLRVLVSPPST